jgi:hypothetical protein
MRKILQWVLSAIGLGGDAEFSWHFLWPWIVGKVLPVISTGGVAALFVLREVPWWAYPVLVPLTLAIGLVAFSGVVRLISNLPRSSRDPRVAAPLSIAGGFVNLGDVTSQNQSGGITGGIVVAEPKRDILGRDALIAELGVFKGSTVKLATLSGDNEGARFAQQLNDAFVSAGWKVTGHSTRLQARQPTGIELWINPGAESMAIKVADLLKDFDVQIRRRRQPSESAPILEILVGFHRKEAGA